MRKWLVLIVGLCLCLNCLPVQAKTPVGVVYDLNKGGTHTFYVENSMGGNRQNHD